MALKLVDGKEIRVPGGAIPEGQRRKGILGKLDGMSLNEFRKMPLIDRLGLIHMANKVNNHGSYYSLSPSLRFSEKGEKIEKRKLASCALDADEVRALIENKGEKKTITAAVICYMEDISTYNEIKKTQALGKYDEVFIDDDMKRCLLRVEYPAVLSDSKSLMTLLMLPQPLPYWNKISFGDIKYIALKETGKEDGKRFIVAMPTQITGYHRNIFHIINKALGYDIGALECLGGGRVNITNNNGKVTIEGKSDDYGACQMDVKKPIDDLLDAKLPKIIAVCQEKGFADLERELVAVFRKKIRELADAFVDKRTSELLQAWQQKGCDSRELEIIIAGVSSKEK